MSRTLYIRDVFGRLGNLLYRFGNVYAHALEHDCRFWDRSLAAAGHVHAFPAIQRQRWLAFPDGAPRLLPGPSLHGLQAAVLERYPASRRAYHWRARRRGFDLSKVGTRVEDPDRPWILEGFRKSA
jgi:hypothetical protein